MNLKRNIQNNMTKKQIGEILNHLLSVVSEECSCKYCLKQEQGTYVEGLIDAIKTKE